MVARSISAARIADDFGNEWQYHSRSDKHSKVACWAVLFDLLQTSALLRTGFHYYNGLSDQYSFYRNFEQQIGGGDTHVFKQDFGVAVGRIVITEDRQQPPHADAVWDF